MIINVVKYRQQKVMVQNAGFSVSGINKFIIQNLKNGFNLEDTLFASVYTIFCILPVLCYSNMTQHATSFTIHYYHLLTESSRLRTLIVSRLWKTSPRTVKVTNVAPLHREVFL